jgi:hypothetical protein
MLNIIKEAANKSDTLGYRNSAVAGIAPPAQLKMRKKLQIFV